MKNGNGVLVRSVDKGSRAEKAGFRAGDIIVKVNNQTVHDTSDFSHAVRSRNSDSVSVGVMRDKREQNLNLPLPPRKESGDLMEEESFDNEPAIEAETAIELSNVRDEIAKLRPEIELAVQNSRKAATEVRKELCREQTEFRRQTERQKLQVRKDLENLRIQLKTIQHDWL